jgi:hypothetical protein
MLFDCTPTIPLLFSREFRWLREITITVAPGLPEQIVGGLVFAGSDPQPPVTLPLEGKILIRLGAPVGTPAANRPLPPLPAGMLGTLNVDNLDGPERRRWPAAYAVNMSLAGSPPPQNPRPALFLNPQDAEELFRGSGHTYAELKKLDDTGKELPWFEIPATLQVKLKFDVADVSSDNLLAVLPGSDPALAAEYVVVSAHLDGYGFWLTDSRRWFV